MAHVRPLSTSTLWWLSNDIKNASRKGVLTPTIELWSFGNPRGLPSSHFGSVSVILTLFQKWGCNNLNLTKDSFVFILTNVIDVLEQTLTWHLRQNGHVTSILTTLPSLCIVIENIFDHHNIGDWILNFFVTKLGDWNFSIIKFQSPQSMTKTFQFAQKLFGSYRKEFNRLINNGHWSND